MDATRPTFRIPLSIVAFLIFCCGSIFAQGLGDDIKLQSTSAAFGAYSYVPQKGVYSKTTIAESFEDFGDAVSGLRTRVADLNRCAGWGSSDGEGDLTWNLGLHVLPSLAGGVNGQFGEPYTVGQPDRFGIHLGLLHFDNFNISYGAIYTDYDGAVPGVVADDGWAQIVWLNFRASLVVGNAISVSLQPILYWLPNQGEIGWGLPAPYAQLAVPPLLQTAALAQIAWAKQVGSWRFAVYDQFSPIIAPYSFWDAAFNTSSPGWYDLSPIDRVGRYSLGYGTQDPGNYRYTTETHLGTNNTGYRPLSSFYNIAGAKAYKHWSSQVESIMYFDKIDVWNDDFDNLLSTISGGFFTQVHTLRSRMYTGYSFVSGDPYDQVLHSAVAGALKSLSSYLSMFAEGGAYWYTGSGSTNQSGWLAQAGLNQQIGSRSYHSVQFGRRVFHPGLQDPAIEDFLEYRLLHRLGNRSDLMFFAGISERHTETNEAENDAVYKFVGAQLTSRLSTRTYSYLWSGWESVEQEAQALDIDRWLNRVGVNSQLTDSVMSQCFYQYEDVHGSQDFSEHLLYLGLTKLF